LSSSRRTEIDPAAAGKEGPRHAYDALDVIECGATHIDPAVGVIDPVDRDLVHAQAVPPREEQQFGVEEPLVVLDHREQALRDVAAYGLETALCVTHWSREHDPQQRVVGARDELPLRVARDGRARCEAGADRDVRVSGYERRDQREQRAQIRREVDIHVRDDCGVACGPRRAQREAPALAIEAESLHTVELVSESGRNGSRAVGGAVVCDGYPPRERELRLEVMVQPADALVESTFLVVDGNDDFDDWRTRAGLDQIRLSCRARCVPHDGKHCGGR
jgi:hypothetical protein